MESVKPVFGTVALFSLIVAICAVRYQQDKHVNDSCKSAGGVVVKFSDGQPTCIRKETIIEIK